MESTALVVCNVDTVLYFGNASWLGPAVAFGWIVLWTMARVGPQQLLVDSKQELIIGLKEEREMNKCELLPIHNGILSLDVMGCLFDLYCKNCTGENCPLVVVHNQEADKYLFASYGIPNKGDHVLPLN